MLLSTVSKSHQVSAPTSKVAKISMLCLLVENSCFLLYPAIKSKVMHTLIYFWFIPGAPKNLSVEADRHRACQITATSPLWEGDSADHSPGCSHRTQGAVEGTCTEARAGQGEPLQPPGCPDHVSTWHLGWRNRILFSFGKEVESLHTQWRWQRAGWPLAEFHSNGTWLLNRNIKAIHDKESNALFYWQSTGRTNFLCRSAASTVMLFLKWPRSLWYSQTRKVCPQQPCGDTMSSLLPGEENTTVAVTPAEHCMHSAEGEERERVVCNALRTWRRTTTHSDLARKRRVFSGFPSNLLLCFMTSEILLPFCPTWWNSSSFWLTSYTIW